MFAILLETFWLHSRYTFSKGGSSIIMSAMESLCHLIGIDFRDLSREETFIIEAELFARLCDELKMYFKKQYRDYFLVINMNTEMEEIMLEDNLMRCVINDILASEEYTISGIALYTSTPEEVIYDVATGINTAPSALIFRKVMALHRTVRRELYDELMRKITSKYLSVSGAEEK